MMACMLVREISSAWQRRLVGRLGLPSRDTRTRSTFLASQQLEHEWVFFRCNITSLTKIFNPLVKEHTVAGDVMEHAIAGDVIPLLVMLCHCWRCYFHCWRCYFHCWWCYAIAGDVIPLLVMLSHCWWCYAIAGDVISIAGDVIPFLAMLSHCWWCYAIAGDVIPLLVMLWHWSVMAHLQGCYLVLLPVGPLQGRSKCASHALLDVAQQRLPKLKCYCKTNARFSAQIKLPSKPHQTCTQCRL